MGEDKKKAELKNCDLYFIGNNKILLYNKDVNKNCDEIGYINEESIFIPEYIIYYPNNTIELINLNNFFKNKFDSFCSDTQNESCHIYDNNN